MRDYHIRQHLKETKLSTYYSDNVSKVVEEMSISSAGARIDVAVINGYFHGFEIKSASDTLNRLPYQIEAYAKVFDFLSIITEDKHLPHLLEITPNWIGISICQEMSKGKIALEEYRPSTKNNLKESFYLTKLLWKDELINLLNAYNLPYKKNQRAWILCETLANYLDVETISKEVRERLKLRTTWKVDYNQL